MKNFELQEARGAEFPQGLLKFEYDNGIRDWGYIYPRSRCGIGVVVLHGHGSHGNQLFVRQDIRHWMDRMLELEVGFMTPNLRDNAWMSPEASADLKELILWAKKEYGWEKIILASGSMGGTGNLIFAILHPELVDAVVALGAATDLPRYIEWLAQQELPVCGEIREAILNSYHYDPETLAAHSVGRHAGRLNMPVWYAHGESDRLMTIGEARALAAKLADRADFHFHEIPGGNHDSPLGLFDKYLEQAYKTIL